MTGGTVVILGEVGDNFAAGMTGGMAFIYDKLRDLKKKLIQILSYGKMLKQIIGLNLNEISKRTFRRNRSQLSKKIINNFNEEVKNLYKFAQKR